MPRRAFALLLAVAFLAVPTRSFADQSVFDSPFGPPEGKAPTAKKVVVLSLAGISLVSFAVSFVFLAQANSADGERRDLITSRGGNPDGGKDSGGCRTVAECDELVRLRDNSRDATSRWGAAMLTGAATGVAATFMLILWPNSTTKSARSDVKVAPMISGAATGAQVEMRF